MEVSRKKERMTGRLSGCGGGVGRVLGSLGEPPSSGVQMASAAKAIVVSSSPHGSPDYLFSGKSPNTGTFILTAEMPARGRKGRRGPPRCGFDPSERGAGSILDLLLSTLFAWETKAQRSRQSKMCRCQGQPGHSTDQPGKKLFFPAGDGCLSCFNFFKKLGQIRFFKCCSKAWRCLNIT